MTKIQGDFTTVDAGREARAALIEAGVSEDRIRIWNKFPDDGWVQTHDGAGAAGALVGGALGGAGGLVAGASVGSFIDAGSEEPHLPAPSGVSVVVDAGGDAEQIESLLRSAGAANIHSLP